MLYWKKDTWPGTVSHGSGRVTRTLTEHVWVSLQTAEGSSRLHAGIISLVTSVGLLGNN